MFGIITSNYQQRHYSLNTTRNIIFITQRGIHNTFNARVWLVKISGIALCEMSEDMDGISDNALLLLGNSYCRYLSAKGRM